MYTTVVVVYRWFWWCCCCCYRRWHNRREWMSVHTTRHNTTQLGRAKNWWWRSRGASKPPTAAAAAPNTRHGSVRFGYSPFFQNFTCLSIYIQKIRLFPKCCCAATGKMIPTLNNTIFTFLFFLYFAIPLVAIFCFFFIIIIVCFVIIWHKFWKQNHNYRRIAQRQHALSWPALDTNRTKIKTKNFSGLTNGKKWHGNTTTQPSAGHKIVEQIM